MTGQDCIGIIGAIAAAQIAMVGALGALYVKVRQNAAALSAVSAKVGSAPS